MCTSHKLNEHVHSSPSVAMVMLSQLAFSVTLPLPAASAASSDGEEQQEKKKSFFSSAVTVG